MYVPNESKVMRNILGWLDENGVKEEEDGPWGALAFLSTKTHQENIQCHGYQWSMCVYYRKLNQVTCPFD